MGSLCGRPVNDACTRRGPTLNSALGPTLAREERARKRENWNDYNGSCSTLPLGSFPKELAEKGAWEQKTAWRESGGR